jgi:hypothetical protein
LPLRAAGCCGAQKFSGLIKNQDGAAAAGKQAAPVQYRAGKQAAPVRSVNRESGKEKHFPFVIWDLTFVIARKSPNVNWAFNQDILKQWRQ